MDGAKLITDTVDMSLELIVVGRRPARAKVSSQGDMNLVGMRILVIVGT